MPQLTLHPTPLWAAGSSHEPRSPIKQCPAWAGNSVAGDAIVAFAPPAPRWRAEFRGEVRNAALAASRSGSLGPAPCRRFGAGPANPGTVTLKHVRSAVSVQVYGFAHRPNFRAGTAFVLTQAARSGRDATATPAPETLPAPATPPPHEGSRLTALAVFASLAGAELLWLCGLAALVWRVMG